jgi:microcompartment protein CcmL/EutN
MADIDRRTVYIQGTVDDIDSAVNPGAKAARVG